MHGYFDIRDLNSDAISDNIYNSVSSINSGIGVVIPVSKIMDIIYDPQRVEERRQLILEQRAQGDGAIPDDAAEENLP
jgi:hypothetical protein